MIRGYAIDVHNVSYPVRMQLKAILQQRGEPISKESSVFGLQNIYGYLFFGLKNRWCGSGRPSTLKYVTARDFIRIYSMSLWFKT